MTNKTKIQYVLATFGIILLSYACANKAQGPTGGPKDITPPSVLKSYPANGSLNFKKKQILIDFDELVSVEKANENVLISPPQVKPPDVKSFGKRVTVDFNEPLFDSTTYTINFGNAIVDLNEKNAVKNYFFSFSTGNEIDTLKIAGTVINAEDLNPLSGIFVGIYKETSDTVFSKKPFLRIGKTDENGRFSINNIKKGAYKVFALGDANRDYFFQPGEGLALYDSLVVPTTRIEQMQDTVWKDTVTVDSIRTYMGTRFLPDDLTLRYFKESKKRQYLVKNERKEPFVFSLFFNTVMTGLPKIKPLNFEWEGKYILQKNNAMDSLTYWITDSLVWKTDTLKMTVSYMKTDSVFNLVPTTDTLNISMRKARLNPKARLAKKATDLKVEPLKYLNNIASTFEIYNPIILNFEAPLYDIDISKIKLSQKIDTTFKTIPFKWRQIDSTKMSYAIDYKWVAENSYELNIDSAAFKSIYNKISNKFSGQFKIRSLDEYSSVKMFLAEFNPKAVLQVLDSKDVVLASKPASEKGTVIQYLKPGDYYVRMFLDNNGNGKWDSGDLASRLQPEEVFYYPKKLTIMANWEFEETWNYRLVPLLKQKPTELIKDASKKKENY
ncbi:MAG TPA: Ig-like domain-containing protein [Paludibacter sp.]